MVGVPLSVSSRALGSFLASYSSASHATGTGTGSWHRQQEALNLTRTAVVNPNGSAESASAAYGRGPGPAKPLLSLLVRAMYSCTVVRARTVPVQLYSRGPRCVCRHIVRCWCGKDCPVTFIARCIPRVTPPKAV
jgi:hypothetical protein